MNIQEQFNNCIKKNDNKELYNELIKNDTKEKIEDF